MGGSEAGVTQSIGRGRFCFETERSESVICDMGVTRVHGISSTRGRLVVGRESGLRNSVWHRGEARQIGHKVGRVTETVAPGRQTGHGGKMVAPTQPPVQVLVTQLTWGGHL